MSFSPSHYRICVQGNLPPFWSHYFDGLTITNKNDKTILSGVMVDQAGLHGLLAKIRDLGLTLVLVELLPTISTKEEKNDTISISRQI